MRPEKKQSTSHIETDVITFSLSVVKKRGLIIETYFEHQELHQESPLPSWKITKNITNMLFRKTSYSSFDIDRLSNYLILIFAAFSTLPPVTEKTQISYRIFAAILGVGLMGMVLVVFIVQMMTWRKINWMEHTKNVSENSRHCKWLLYAWWLNHINDLASITKLK